jgi:vacuolar-type H+-ATPase subunit D/Vma8
MNLTDDRFAKILDDLEEGAMELEHAKERGESTRNAAKNIQKARTALIAEHTALVATIKDLVSKVDEYNAHFRQS